MFFFVRLTCWDRTVVGNCNFLGFGDGHWAVSWTPPTMSFERTAEDTASMLLGRLGLLWRGFFIAVESWIWGHEPHGRIQLFVRHVIFLYVFVSVLVSFLFRLPANFGNRLYATSMPSICFLNYTRIYKCHIIDDLFVYHVWWISPSKQDTRRYPHHKHMIRDTSISTTVYTHHEVPLNPHKSYRIGPPR